MNPRVWTGLDGKQKSVLNLNIDWGERLREPSSFNPKEKREDGLQPLSQERRDLVFAEIFAVCVPLETKKAEEHNTHTHLCCGGFV